MDIYKCPKSTFGKMKSEKNEKNELLRECSEYKKNTKKIVIVLFSGFHVKNIFRHFIEHVLELLEHFSFFWNIFIYSQYILDYPS